MCFVLYEKRIQKGYYFYQVLYPVKLMFDWVFCVLAYRLYTVVPRLVKFIDYLTNVYVRMNRKRIRVWNKFYFSRDFYFPENFTSGHNLNKTPQKLESSFYCVRFVLVQDSEILPSFLAHFLIIRNRGISLKWSIFNTLGYRQLSCSWSDLNKNLVSLLLL